MRSVRGREMCFHCECIHSHCLRHVHVFSPTRSDWFVLYVVFFAMAELEHLQIVYSKKKDLIKLRQTANLERFEISPEELTTDTVPSHTGYVMVLLARTAAERDFFREDEPSEVWLLYDRFRKLRPYDLDYFILTIVPADDKAKKQWVMLEQEVSRAALSQPELRKVHDRGCLYVYSNDRSFSDTSFCPTSNEEVERPSFIRPRTTNNASDIRRNHDTSNCAYSDIQQALQSFPDLLQDLLMLCIKESYQPELYNEQDVKESANKLVAEFTSDLWSIVSRVGVSNAGDETAMDTENAIPARIDQAQLVQILKVMMKYFPALIQRLTPIAMHKALNCPKLEPLPEDMRTCEATSVIVDEISTLQPMQEDQEEAAMPSESKEPLPAVVPTLEVIHQPIPSNCDDSMHGATPERLEPTDNTQPQTFFGRVLDLISNGPHMSVPSQ